jgi:hypothetical protein
VIPDAAPGQLTVTPELLAILLDQKRRQMEREEQLEAWAENAEAWVEKEKRPALLSAYQRMIERVVLSNQRPHSFDFRIMPSGQDMLVCPLTPAASNWILARLPWSAKLDFREVGRSAFFTNTSRTPSLPSSSGLG